MNAPDPILIDLPAVGAPYLGGLLAGLFQLDDGTRHALIVAPQTAGEFDDVALFPNGDECPAARSYCDGLANTKALAAAGSPLAQKILALDIDGHADWYLPSQDELEIIYRAFKPTEEENSCYARSGINLAALPATRPYTTDSPAQTGIPAFQEGGSEAFLPHWYWSSTIHAAYAGCAWYQSFYYGNRYYHRAGSQLRARAVRRVAI